MKLAEIEELFPLDFLFPRSVRDCLSDLRAMWPFELSRDQYEKLAKSTLRDARKRGLITYSEWSRLYYSYIDN